MSDPRSSKAKTGLGLLKRQKHDRRIAGMTSTAPPKKSRPAGQPPPPRRRTMFLPLTGPRGRFLSHAARHETSDRDLIVKPHRPNDRASCPVRFGDHGIVGNVDPVVLEANPIVPVFGFP